MNKKMKTYSKDDKDSATPGLSLNNVIKADCSSVSQHIIKPNVVCCLVSSPKPPF
jgi:hypothetical protein